MEGSVDGQSHDAAGAKAEKFCGRFFNRADGAGADELTVAVIVDRIHVVDAGETGFHLLVGKTENGSHCAGIFFCGDLH